MSGAALGRLLPLTRAPGLPLTLRKKLARLVSLPPGIPFRVPVFEGVYLGETGSRVDDKVYLYGLHEAATIRLMRRLLRHDRASGRRPVLFDVGTNTGLHLVACAPLCDAAHGFEPWEPMRLRAEASVAASGLRNVVIHPFGLSDQAGRLPFTLPDARNTGTGSFAGAGGGPLLELRRGDDVAAEGGDVPSLVKIDTEGFELPVLRGLSRIIAEHRPAIVFEVGGPRGERAATLRDVAALLPADYRILGLLRSAERPWLFPLRPGGRCENALAWPAARGRVPHAG